LKFGATPGPQGVRFAVWAPKARRVEVVLGETEDPYPLRRSDDGVWSATVGEAGRGTLYRFRLDGRGPFPDPYSRSQPEGVHGPSQVVDPTTFQWHDDAWRGLSVKGLVLYQAHVGTMTSDGTFDAFVEQLPRLRSLGISAIEPLPIAEFPGARNWGYDGVDLFAPSHLYGGPDAFKRFIDAAHHHGIGVVLDVVYNHFGPDGNYLRAYSEDYFTDRYDTPWGAAINFDGPRSQRIRQLVLDNARYWLREFHVDGLRLDATHAMHDRSSPHILAELTRSAREAVGPTRQVALIAETHENDVRYLQPVENGGFGLDAVWADDFHHALRRYLAGDHEAYYANYQGTLVEVARCIQQGWLFAGQATPGSGLEEVRGTPADEQPAWQFLYVIENHDQVGNRALGDRLNQDIDLGRFLAASALLLFLPMTPMLFMGQEYAAASPFQYFTDHTPELGRLVTEGRRREFKDFSAFATPAERQQIPDPQAVATFLASRLHLEEADQAPGAEVQELYRQLIALRREDPVLSVQERNQMRAEALAPDVLAIRRWLNAPAEMVDRSRDAPDVTPRVQSSGAAPMERLFLANFGDMAARGDAFGGGWRLLRSTSGMPCLDEDGVTVPPRTAVILARGRA
jgi:maltooligosyltrehalose trehalohydrolase